MGNSVAGATGVRSLPIVGAVSGSSPFVGKRRGGLADERRAAALDVNVDRMLIGASLRASKRLRATAPRLSAATLGWRGRTAPSSPSDARTSCHVQRLARFGYRSGVVATST